MKGEEDVLRHVVRTVPARLHDIDLSGPRPWPILVLAHGQHPQCRPEPVTSRQFGADLHSPVLDRVVAAGVDARTHDGRDDCLAGEVRYGATVRRVRVRAAGDIVRERRVSAHGVVPNNIRGERRDDVESSVSHEGVVRRVCRHLELLVAAGRQTSNAQTDREAE